MASESLKSNRPVIGIIGKMGSGKNAIGEMLIECGYVPMAFADPLKRIIYQMWGTPKGTLWGDSGTRNDLTRLRMQSIGDCLRESDPDVIVNYMKDRLYSAIRGNGDTCDILTWGETANAKGFVITDVRMPAEAVMLKDFFEAPLIKVVRPDTPQRQGHDHATEMVDEIDGKHIDVTICNSGSLNDLKCMYKITMEELLCSKIS